MAAHIKTALEQIRQDINRGSVNFSHLCSASSLSSWTDDLDLVDYTSLSNVANSESVELLDKWIVMVYLKYKNEWLKLGKPDTREQWHNAKYRGKWNETAYIE